MVVELDRLTVNVRPRRPWEAADLGVRMVQRWWRVLWAPYLILLWGLALLLYGFLPAESLMVGGYVLWWLKPLYDRLLLSVLARATFGDPPTVGETLRALPGLLRTGLLTGLTLGRLDPQRSFHLPVWQLEGLRGKRRRVRRDVLGRRVGGHALGLTLLWANLEISLLLSCYGLVWMMLPETVELDFAHWLRWEGDQTDANLVYLSFYLLTISIVEPFYVASGFALYLNRRTRLEGWDLELAFRRLVSRLAPTTLVLLLCLGHSAPAPAGETVDFRTEIKEILSNKEFDQHKEVDRWRLRDAKESEQEVPEITSMGWLVRLGEAMGVAVEALLWLLAAAVVYFLYRWREHWWPVLTRMPRKKTRPEVVGIANGGELDAPMPVDEVVSACARGLWEAGHPREAMALLYRTAVEALTRTGLTLPAGATEGDVLRVASKAQSPGYDYLRSLTRHWRATAYAHRLPGEGDFFSLCDAWPDFLRALPA